MRLRTRIQPPDRFEDEDYNTSAASDTTKPAFPSLLKEQTLAYNPRLPPAAFPSLTAAHPSKDAGRISDDHSEPADIDMRDTGRPPDHLGTQAAWQNSSGGIQDPPVFRTSSLHDVESSDSSHEEDCDVSLQSILPVDTHDSDQRDLIKTQQDRVDRTGCHPTPSISWSQLAPVIQVEIFENACASCYGHANFDILGLSNNELHDVSKHLRARNKQIMAEDLSIEELQQAQLRAILRKDHPSSLGANSWRDHVACTRKQLPHISVRPDYFICNKAEMELASKFLDKRGIDIRVLGEWGRNKNNHDAVSQIPTKAFQGSQSRDGVDSGYTYKIPKQGTRHSTTTSIVRAPPRNALSEISNSILGGLNGLSSDHRKRSHSMLETGQDTVASQHHRVGSSTAVVSPTAPADSQLAGSLMILRARGSHQTVQFKNAMAAMMRTRRGASEDSYDSYEDSHRTRQASNPPPHEIHPPKPQGDSQYLDDGNILASTGQRAITFKISPRRPDKVQAIRSLDTRPSTIRTQGVLTPPTMASAQNSINDTSKQKRLRPQQQMPVARKPLTFHDPGELSVFSLKLLEVQRGAAGFIYAS
jgi:hypothetical protein